MRADHEEGFTRADVFYGFSTVSQASEKDRIFVEKLER
jgi:hypothetical protein